MKTIFITVTAALAILVACNNGPENSNDRAIDNARTYLQSTFSGEVDSYEEVKWGNVEPRRVDWKSSNRYRMYNDTITMMQQQLRLMNDSLEMEQQLHGAETPYYQTLRLRRDGYQMYYTTYSNEVERMKAYDSDPEYRGYWIYHEYNMDGSPKRVRIIFDDTASWHASEIIYEE